MSAQRIVLDASVAVKWVLIEAGSERANELLGGESELLAPQHVQVEMTSAVVRAYRMNRVQLDDAREALAQIALICSGRSIALFTDIALLGRASEIALDIKHPLKDCLYIALAEQEQCDLITTDQTLIARAGGAFPFLRAL